jgi:hypothetical protein
VIFTGRSIRIRRFTERGGKAYSEARVSGEFSDEVAARWWTQATFWIFPRLGNK